MGGGESTESLGEGGERPEGEHHGGVPKGAGKRGDANGDFDKCTVKNGDKKCGGGINGGEIGRKKILNCEGKMCHKFQERRKRNAQMQADTDAANI